MWEMRDSIAARISTYRKISTPGPRNPQQTSMTG